MILDFNMGIKKTQITFCFLLFIFCFLSASAQQIPLKGVVAVQNSKINTGKTQYVKNAEITHTNAKNDVTDDDGKFTLNIIGLKQNIQTQITVFLSGAYKDYVIVNEKELQSITLGRLTPVGVYICKKGELEQRQAEMVGINMRKLEERMDADKKRLQKELEDLKSKNDYLNVRYSEIKDSLDIISKNIDKAFERIKEYAKSMVLENLDDKDNNYVKAYDCFSRGELDSVSFYLQDQELELKHKKILQLQEEAKKEKELAEILTASARAKEEYSENILNELLKEWLLLARTHNMKNDYEKTILYYEKAIFADTLNMDNLFEFAKYLHSIREYAQAEKYYLQCLERYRKLEKENPNTYLVDVARVLNRLAFLHRIVNEHTKALEEYNEALEIRRKLAAENPNYLADLATTLNDLAVLHRAGNEHTKALEEYEEALTIRRKLARKNPKEYLVDIAQTLNNLAILHLSFKEYPKASEELEEALIIYRELAKESPRVYLTDVATILNNLAILHRNFKDYSKASEKYEEALEIQRKLAAENPKVHIPNVAMILNNLALVHENTKEYSQALKEYEEALETYRKLAAENPKTYLCKVAITLDNLALLLANIKEYPQALEKHKEALEIFRDLAAKNPKIYSGDVAETLNNFAKAHQSIKEYSKALEKYDEALEIYKKLAAENPKVYTPHVAITLNNLSNYCLFTQEYAKSEQYASKALELDPTEWRGKAYFANSLLFQNRFLEAEKIYKELLQTTDTEVYKSLLEDFDKLEKTDAIPEERKNDIEKIRKMIMNQNNPENHSSDK